MNSDCSKHHTIIRSDMARRGNGKDDPIRGLIQYFDFDGNKILEYDPVTKKTWVDPERL